MVNIGAPTILSSEIIKSSRGTAIISTYLEYCLKVASVLLKQGYGIEDFEQTPVTDALFFVLKHSDS